MGPNVGQRIGVEILKRREPAVALSTPPKGHQAHVQAPLAQQRLLLQIPFFIHGVCPVISGPLARPPDAMLTDCDPA